MNWIIDLQVGILINCWSFLVFSSFSTLNFFSKQFYWYSPHVVLLHIISLTKHFCPKSIGFSLFSLRVTSVWSHMQQDTSRENTGKNGTTGYLIHARSVILGHQHSLEHVPDLKRGEMLLRRVDQITQFPHLDAVPLFCHYTISYKILYNNCNPFDDDWRKSWTRTEESQISCGCCYISSVYIMLYMEQVDDGNHRHLHTAASIDKRTNRRKCVHHLRFWQSFPQLTFN